MPDKRFETKNGKEVSCEAMILSFPVFWNEMIYTLLFIMFFVSCEKVFLMYIKYVGIFSN